MKCRVGWSTFWRISALGFLWREWCWSWNSSTLATSCEELTHWKRLWCWEGLGARGEGYDRGWDGWMAITESMDMNLSELWELVVDREAWCAVIHGVTKSQTRLSNWTELNWTEAHLLIYKKSCLKLGWITKPYLSSSCNSPVDRKQRKGGRLLWGGSWGKSSGV